MPTHPTTPSAGESASGPQSEDPSDWKAGTPLIDSDEPRIRIKAASLTQLARDEHERARIIHDFVKRIPLRLRLRPGVPTARQVLDARRGNASEKATLFIALLRAAGFAARLRYVEVGAPLLRGLVPFMASAYRPLVEVWVGARWVRLDTHIFEVPYMAAARQRLRDEGESFGYGIARDGHTLWNGRDDAWLGMVPAAHEQVLRADLGLFRDEAAFLASPAYASRHSRLGRDARWSVHAPFMNRVIEQLRAEGGQTSPAPRKART